MQTLKNYQILKDAFPPLKPDLEKKYIIEAQKGSVEARDLIIFSNLHALIRYVMIYNEQKVDLNELMQEGILALIDAIYQFDVEKNSTFSNYAFWKIVGKFTNYFRQENIISYPAHIVDCYHRVRRLQKDKNMTYEEIIERLNIDSNKQKTLRQYSEPILSLEEADKLIALDPIEEIETKVNIENLRMEFENILSSLSTENYNLLKLRHIHFMPFREIAAKLNISTSKCCVKVKLLENRLKGYRTLREFNENL